MHNRSGILGATVAAAALAGAFMATPAEAAGRHHGWRDHHGYQHRMMHHTMRGRHVMRHSMAAPGPRYVTGANVAQYPQTYRSGYHDNGFNPITGVLGAAATIATAPFAIVTGGYPYGGYYGEPAYAAPVYGYGYGYGYEGPGWPKRGPYYNTW